MAVSVIRKSFAVLAIAGGVFAAAAPAEAGWRHGRGGNAAGAAFAAGIFGLAAGAIIASQTSRAHAAPAYGYAPSYGYAPAYSGYQQAYSGHDGGYGYAPQCFIKQKPFWDAYEGWQWRDVQVCR